MVTQDQAVVQAFEDAPESTEGFVKLISIRRGHLDFAHITKEALCERVSFKYWCYLCQTPLGGLRIGLGKQCVSCNHPRYVMCVMCWVTDAACVNCDGTRWKVV
eukprot:55601-Eustigmatos_ZCMA.PRE.2